MFLAHLEFEVLQNLPEQERVTALRSIQEGLDPVVTETVADWRGGVSVTPGSCARAWEHKSGVDPRV